MAPLAPAYAERIRPELFLSFSGSDQLNESERVKSTLEGPIVKQGGKKPSSTNFFNSDIRNNQFQNEKKN